MSAARDPTLGPLNVASLNKCFEQMKSEYKSSYIATGERQVYYALALTSESTELTDYIALVPGFLIAPCSLRASVDIKKIATLPAAKRLELELGGGDYEYEVGINAHAFVDAAPSTIADPTTDPLLKAYLKSLLKEVGAVLNGETVVWLRYNGESSTVIARLVAHWRATSNTKLGCPVMLFLKKNAVALGATFNFVISAGLPELTALMKQFPGTTSRQAQGYFEVARYLLRRTNRSGKLGLGLCMAAPGGSGFGRSTSHMMFQRVWTDRTQVAFEVLGHVQRALGIFGKCGRVGKGIFDAVHAAAGTTPARLFYSADEREGKGRIFSCTVDHGRGAQVGDDDLTLRQLQTAVSIVGRRAKDKVDERDRRRANRARRVAASHAHAPGESCRLRPHRARGAGSPASSLVSDPL